MRHALCPCAVPLQHWHLFRVQACLGSTRLGAKNVAIQLAASAVKLLYISLNHVPLHLF